MTLLASIGFVLIGLWCFHVPVGPVLRVLNSALAVLVLADIIRFRSKRFEVSWTLSNFGVWSQC